MTVVLDLCHRAARCLQLAENIPSRDPVRDCLLRMAAEDCAKASELLSTITDAGVQPAKPFTSDRRGSS